MEFDSNKPIYVQIADAICNKVLSGEFRQGERIPSVRECGATIGVNPNTVARSYEILTDRGVIRNQRGIGFFVADNAAEAIKDNERRHFIENELPAFISRAQLLGLDLNELINNK